MRALLLISIVLCFLISPYVRGETANQCSDAFSSEQDIVGGLFETIRHKNYDPKIFVLKPQTTPGLSFQYEQAQGIPATELQHFNFLIHTLSNRALNLLLNFDMKRFYPNHSPDQITAILETASDLSFLFTPDAIDQHDFRFIPTISDHHQGLTFDGIPDHGMHGTPKIGDIIVVHGQGDDLPTDVFLIAEPTLRERVLPHIAQIWPLGDQVTYAHSFSVKQLQELTRDEELDTFEPVYRRINGLATYVKALSQSPEATFQAPVKRQ